MEIKKNPNFALPSIENMTFGEAIEAMKNGYTVQRKNWNGKGMHLWIKPGIVNAAYVVKEEAAGEPLRTEFGGVSANLFEPMGGDVCTVYPHICMCTADTCIVNGWLASQTDMLAQDWQIVP